MPSTTRKSKDGVVRAADRVGHPIPGISNWPGDRSHPLRGKVRHLSEGDLIIRVREGLGIVALHHHVQCRIRPARRQDVQGRVERLPRRHRAKVEWRTGASCRDHAGVKGPARHQDRAVAAHSEASQFLDRTARSPHAGVQQQSCVAGLTHRAAVWEDCEQGVTLAELGGIYIVRLARSRARSSRWLQGVPIAGLKSASESCCQRPCRLVPLDRGSA